MDKEVELDKKRTCFETTKSLELAGNIRFSGYVDEYIFERVYNERVFYEQNLLEKWFKPKDNWVVYDIGANIGNHTIYFASAIDNAQIYAFEPIPENFTMLERNVADNSLGNRVHLFPFAVGESSGTVRMDINHLGNGGSATVVNSPGSDALYTVEMVAIDTLNLPIPDFIKIDVEGFEENVLRGMQETLKKMEKGIVWIEINEKNATSVHTLMTEFGFFVSDADLAVDNNVVFEKTENLKNSSTIIFNKLLDEAYRKRQLWGERRKAFSGLENEKEVTKNLTIELQSVCAERDMIGNKLNMMRSERDTIRNERDAVRAERDAVRVKLNNAENNMQKMQKELDMFRNSRMINFMRFWVWKMPKLIRQKVKSVIKSFVYWVYVKTGRYLYVREQLSKLNRKFKIIKNPQDFLASNNKQQPLAHLNSEKQPLDQLTPPMPNVAMIVDEFTYNSFKFECNAFPIEPENWRKVFENNPIDFFFCESAWCGADDIRRPWKAQIYASENFHYENRKNLLQILEYCKANKIPTVFWNKEDPTYYNNKVINFVDTALKFDHIFTTDMECVKRYQQDHGHKSVHLLMFAAQPKLFNPIERYDRNDEIVFAGSWYKNHVKRAEEMEQIFDKILNSGYALKIYNRQSESSDPNFTFPEKYHMYIHPALEHDRLDEAYKSSNYALNINTVTDSSTMFARRVFELMCSNTLVLSNYSVGIERLFGKNVIFVDDKNSLDLSDADKKRRACLYEVLRHHTYANRFTQILDVIGQPYQITKPKVLFVYQVYDLSSAKKAVIHFRGMQWENKLALLSLPNDIAPQHLNAIFTNVYNGYIQVIFNKDQVAAIEGCNADYLIETDTNLPFNFVSDAILHYSYLDQDTAVAAGERSFVFGIIKKDQRRNMLLPSANYEKIEQVYYI